MPLIWKDDVSVPMYPVRRAYLGSVHVASVAQDLVRAGLHKPDHFRVSAFLPDLTLNLFFFESYALGMQYIQTRVDDWLKRANLRQT